MRHDLDSKLIEACGSNYFLRHGGGWKSDKCDVSYYGYDAELDTENWAVWNNITNEIVYKGTDHDEIVRAVESVVGDEL